MEPEKTGQDNSEAMGYVKSLRDPVKRRFGLNYLAWIRSGKPGSPPSRGNLSPTVWKRIVVNLDSLA